MIYGCYNGALIVYLTELMPEDVRTSCFSMAYSCATIIGGTTPAAVTALIHFTGNGAMPGAYVAMAAVVALVAVLIASRIPVQAPAAGELTDIEPGGAAVSQIPATPGMS